MKLSIPEGMLQYIPIMNTIYPKLNGCWCYESKNIEPLNFHVSTPKSDHLAKLKIDLDTFIAYIYLAVLQKIGILNVTDETLSNALQVYIRLVHDMEELSSMIIDDNFECECVHTYGDDNLPPTPTPVDPIPSEQISSNIGMTNPEPGSSGASDIRAQRSYLKLAATIDMNLDATSKKLALHEVISSDKQLSEYLNNKLISLFPPNVHYLIREINILDYFDDTILVNDLLLQDICIPTFLFPFFYRIYSFILDKQELQPQDSTTKDTKDVLLSTMRESITATTTLNEIFKTYNQQSLLETISNLQSKIQTLSVAIENMNTKYLNPAAGPSTTVQNKAFEEDASLESIAFGNVRITSAASTSGTQSIGTVKFVKRADIIGQPIKEQKIVSLDDSFEDIHFG